jgi:hypothetical protein
MYRQGKQVLFSLLTIFTILLSACGGANSTSEAAISTAVAQTVAAQNAQQPTATQPASLTSTPLGLALTPALVTPQATRVPPTLPSGGDYASCLRANLISETVPDGTILAPGEHFTKTWQIQNNSTCTWNSNYQIVFWDGDMLGGAYYYNFPQTAAPGQTVDVPLVLVAPTANGNYESYWMLKAPDGTAFGVGSYSQPFYTRIVVSDASRPDYGVLSVTYDIVRDPPTGCPRNIWYTVNATITVSGPSVISYYWDQSDGNESGIQTLRFTQAGSQTVSRDWKVGLTDSQNDRWMRIIVAEPDYVEYDKAVWAFPCK